MKPEDLILWGAAALAVYVMFVHKPQVIATAYPIGGVGGSRSGFATPAGSASGSSDALWAGAVTALGVAALDDFTS